MDISQVTGDIFTYIDLTTVTYMCWSMFEVEHVDMIVFFQWGMTEKIRRFQSHFGTEVSLLKVFFKLIISLSFQILLGKLHRKNSCKLICGWELLNVDVPRIPFK